MTRRGKDILGYNEDRRVLSFLESKPLNLVQVSSIVEVNKLEDERRNIVSNTVVFIYINAKTNKKEALLCRRA